MQNIGKRSQLNFIHFYIIIYSGICLITVLRSNWLQCPNIDMSKPQMDMLWVCTHESGLDIRLEGR